MSGQARVTLRRTVPFRLRPTATAMEATILVTINDLRDDEAVLGLAGDGLNERVKVGVGSDIVIGERTWQVAQIVPGDRGSVVLTAPGGPALDQDSA